MAEPKDNPLMEKIVSLCKRRGFIFQSSEIYGGINGFWDYGPLGAELKRNVKELWWHAMTRQRDDVAGLEATIIMSPQIWKASGHVDTFADLMRECPLTKKRVRADQVEPQSGIAVSFEGSVSKYNFDLAMTVCSALLKQESEEARKSMLLNIATQFVSAKKPLSAEESKAAFEKQIGDATKANLQAAIHQLAILEMVKFLREGSSNESITILLQAGKPIESGRKVASEFYISRGISEPILLCERNEKVENSNDFHPESRVRLSEARPFNLMFKTYVG